MYPVKKPKRRIKKKFVAFLFLLMAVLPAALLFIRENQFRLELTDADDLCLEYGQPYTQPKILVSLKGRYIFPEGKTLDIPVRCEGTVDTGRVGIYSLCYRAEFLGLEDCSVQQITVVDTDAPELILEGEDTVHALEGTQPEEPGFHAWDDYDGDITHQVVVTLEGSYLRYSVTDSSGNEAVAQRQVIWYPSDAPRFELLGGSELTVDAGHTFTDPGFEATDFSDGDVTDLVIMTGEVDGYHAGVYTLTYSVTDSQGNYTEVHRRVTVRAAEQPKVEIPEEKVIYLTFDDGPGPYTQALLEILAKYDVKATFFVTDTGYAYLIADMVAQGHSVGIHTMTHDYQAIYAGEEAFFAELYGMQDIIYQQSGVRTTLLRFPGGSSNMVSRFNEGIMTSLTVAVTDAGFQYYDWNVDSCDAGGARTAEEVFENTVAGIEGKHYAIVLQHDIKPYSVEAVEMIILWGLENGYTFRALESTSPGCHHHVNN